MPPRYGRFGFPTFEYEYFPTPVLKIDNRTPLKEFTIDELSAELKRREEEKKREERQKLLAELTWKNVFLVHQGSEMGKWLLADLSRTAFNAGYKFFTYGDFSEVYIVKADGLYSVALDVTTKDIK